MRLHRLHIRNIALIEKAELELAPGLTVLTGETGAGKSMLMDALALATGARATANLLRVGASQGSVEASFTLDKPAQKALAPLLEEAGISLENPDEITLRRVLEADRSSAFVEGMKVPLQVQKNLGEILVDIHGQHEHQLLFKPSAHAQLLDAFGGHQKQKTATHEAYHLWQEVETTRRNLAQKAADRGHQLQLLQSFVDELKDLNPQVGEVDTLTEERQTLMAAEKNQQALQTALAGLGDDTVSSIVRAERALSSAQHPALDELTTRLAELATLANDLAHDLNQVADRLLPDPERLTQVDERLFAIKDCARKHKCQPDELPAMFTRLSEELSQLSHAEESLADLEAEALKRRAAYLKAAEQLSAARTKAAQQLQKHLHQILTPLKMPDTQFEAKLLPRDEAEWSGSGLETVSFYVATNKGAVPQPLEKVASGGEASRLLLALKTVMYQAQSSRTLVFDEIDTGVGGAVAAAVGENLLSLASQHQVLVITHQPQVAAKGQHHLKIEKSSQGQTTLTRIQALTNPAERLDEVARMLSGKDITEAARAAAASLLAS